MSVAAGPKCVYAVATPFSFRTLDTLPKMKYRLIRLDPLGNMGYVLFKLI